MNIADALLTNHLIKTETAREGNPLLLHWAGEPGLLILKIAGVLMASFILWDVRRRYPRLAFWVASFFLLVYCGIVVWNLSLVISG